MHTIIICILTASKKISQSFDWAYFKRFLLIFIPLYYCNLYYWGLIDPKNYYSLFLATHFNYFSVITASILHTSNVFLHWLAVNTLVQGKLIYVVNGTSLSMDVPCIGLGIMFFWIAYIAAGIKTIKHKIQWCLGGLAAIWLLNCLRVTVLMYSLENSWNIGQYVDAHDLFNYAAYSIILLFIWLEGKSKNENPSLLINDPTLPLAVS
ncbi:MAG: exosortase/archaeosortase family protein [Chitinophagaceae bacterium]|nr:exosortase/archaeosortase family protein [Chitinophagaceae bacterium]